ncbi:MAG: ABC transporter permease [Krumholzibacteria bacterium]|nr:ABC transporter permease [Candidatus Krumholzibacteria bacterium]
MIGKRSWTVARWEFLRFAKTKDLIIGTLVLTGVYGGGQLFGEFVAARANQQRTVAVVDAARLDLHEPRELGTFRLVPETRAPAVVDSLLLAAELDAALVRVEGGWQLRARRDHGWLDGLRLQVGALVREAALVRLEPDPRMLAVLAAPVEIPTVLVDPGAAGGGQRAGVMVVVFVVGAMLLGLLTGFSYVFVAITAEKTQRTTESLLSVLRPQEWIDGKIIGLTGVVLVNLLSFLVAWYLWQGVSWLFLDRTVALPGGLGGWDLLLSVAFAAAGFAFWFTLFALVAATIDDPNSSGRSSLMFLPLLPLSVVFAGLDSADAVWMRALALIPGVSPTAMPVRLLRGEPAVWEIVVSLALLVAGALLMRWAAGRVFGISMLMTGKEPGLREVLRWLREPA